MEMEKRLYVPADDIEVQDIESGESLRVRGACRKKENDTSQKRSSAEKLQRDDWIERKRNTLMIVASLIATMAFQAGLNPPSGVWQEDLQGYEANHTAGSSVMADKFPNGYRRYLIANTIGFMASLSVIILLISGLPLRKKGLMWILMFIMWIAVSATAYTYGISISVFTPESQEEPLANVVGISVFIWIGLMALLFLIHTIRLMAKAVRKLRQSAVNKS
ncbi:uncharacterized protein LOC142179605 [Nicotiana tabacum]|uniref:Uncharacterized protein LOC142179605 n=1 Tax=Nicotiana tabacum TaxID=4097 RepID=A0AC58UB40_TOBAC